MMTTSQNTANSLINQGPSPCCNLGWIVSFSRSLKYIMQTICVSKICLKSRNHLIPCEIHLNLYNRNVQSKRNTTTFGLRSFTYLGSKLWNDLPNDFKDADLALFRDRLRQWDGPNIDDVINFYLYLSYFTTYIPALLGIFTRLLPIYMQFSCWVTARIHVCESVCTYKVCFVCTLSSMYIGMSEWM